VDIYGSQKNNDYQLEGQFRILIPQLLK
jgi:hypothetical protein